MEQGLSAVRVYQDLITEHGNTGSYDSVRRFAKRLCRTRELPFCRFAVEPGFEMQVDSAMGVRCKDHEGKLRKSHVFRCVLSHSRKGYCKAVRRLTTESFIRSLENAFCVDRRSVPRPFEVATEEPASSTTDHGVHGRTSGDSPDVGLLKVPRTSTLAGG